MKGFHERKKKLGKRQHRKEKRLEITLDKLSQLNCEAVSPYPASYLQKPGPLSEGM